MKTRNQMILALVLVLGALGVVAARSVGGASQDPEAGGMEGHDHSAMAASDDEAQPVTLAPDAGTRIGVTYAPVRRGALSRTVSTVGFVTYDETRLTAVTPKVEGWVERLYVDYTGASVREGDPLLDVYSPGLVTAQEELLLAHRLLDQTRTASQERPRADAQELVEAARRRLAYWDIPEDEIRAIEERGAVTKTLTLRAPADGIVVEKNVVEGARIMPGADLYRLADLSRVWIDADVFEKDLSLVREGQQATVTMEAYPGEAFRGSVAYVYPTVSTSARTGRVRIELSNPGLKLKPGMYADVTLDLTPVEETLLVPRAAVINTGKRSVAFKRMADGRLHPIEVVTGLASGDDVQILSGLEEGDVVVSSATFLIDAESNLGAAMAGMAGMDMSGMDMSGEGAAADSTTEAMSGMDMGGGGEAASDSSAGGMNGMNGMDMGSGGGAGSSGLSPAGHGTGGSGFDGQRRSPDGRS